MGILNIRLSPESAETAKSKLLTHDIAMYPQLVPEKLCLHLLSRTKNFTTGLPPFLMNYEEYFAGRSFKDRNWTEQIFQECNLDAHNPRERGKLPDSNRKTVLVQLMEGSKRYAHQEEDNKEFPCQAHMMLSEPGVDFDGGEFFHGMNEIILTPTNPYCHFCEVRLFHKIPTTNYNDEIEL
ncbi:hypothetical protein TL16_g08320 [Triparma laevis f. inornata]|uniref:Uncharacterized protein n=1 Tax=Triparma laevis f. inornata TaxID=1714386 RepID=A0A9W7EK52_9STRA|nr:hypothetical protein TL16_g08320 [Triparma laevis f. inornata]